MEQDTTGGGITQSDLTPSPVASATDTAAPPRARKPRRRGRWIAITIIVILLLILGAGGGAGYFAYRQYPAINAAGLRFCNDLLGQKYSDAYSLLSSRLRHRYSQADFVSMNQTLDTTEGKATLCGQASSGAFQVGVFPLTVAVATELTRAAAGNHEVKREGSVTFVYEGGNWLVDDLSTSLLGVNIGGLLTAQLLCANLATQPGTTAALTQKYANIWALYGAALRTKTTEADFIEVGSLHDQMDGKIEECSITAIGQNNTNALTTVTITAKHTYSVETQAAATLRQENGVWRFETLDPSIYGRDMAPALVATKWFAAMTSGDCSAAYAVLSAATQKRVTLAQFTAHVCGAPVVWSFYSLDPATYTEETPTKYTADLIEIPSGDIASLRAYLAHPYVNYIGSVSLVYSNGSWWVDSLVLI